MEKFDLDNFIAQAITGRGALYVDPQVLAGLIPVLDSLGYWVTRLEAYEMRGEREITNIDFAVIGLDGPENWEEHEDIDRHTRLVVRHIEAAIASGMPIQFQVWIEKK